MEQENQLPEKQTHIDKHTCIDKKKKEIVKKNQTLVWHSEINKTKTKTQKHKKNPQLIQQTKIQYPPHPPPKKTTHKKPIQDD